MRAKLIVNESLARQPRAQRAAAFPENPCAFPARGGRHAGAESAEFFMSGHRNSGASSRGERSRGLAAALRDRPAGWVNERRRLRGDARPWAALSARSDDSQGALPGNGHRRGRALHQDFQGADAPGAGAAQAGREQTHVAKDFSSQLAQELAVLFQKVAGE